MLILFFILSFIIRGAIILFSKNINNFDLSSYILVGKALFEGKSIYPQIAINRYPYFPFFLYFQLFAYFLEKKFTFSSIVFFKLIINLFDLGNALLIYKLTKKNFKKTTFYLFNPVSILIFCFHGQFDAIPLFFFLLSLYLLKQKNELLGLIIFSLSVLAKPWPVFFLPLIFFSLKKRLLIIITPLATILAILVYIFFWPTDFFSVFYPVVAYRSLFDVWGIGFLIKNLFFKDLSQTPIFLQKTFLFLFIKAFFVYSLFLAKKKGVNLINKIFFLLIFFYAFTVGFSVQYFSWLIPFLFVLRSFPFFLYLNLLIYCSLNYFLWILPNDYFLKNLFLNFSVFLWIIFLISWISMNKEPNNN